MTRRDATRRGATEPVAASSPLVAWTVGAFGLVGFLLLARWRGCEAPQPRG